MNMLRCWFLMLYAVLFCHVNGQDKTILFDYSILQNNKSKISNPAIKTEIDGLRKQANTFLKLPLLSVVTKPELPPSQNKHDFYSLSIYWWPNPKTKSGLPYIPKDGKPNPGRLKIKDLSNLIQVSKAVKTLGLAYYYTGDRKYSEKAQSILYNWFINEKTKMNPNLNYSGFIPGVSNGRPEGIIDGRYFVELIDGMILSKSGISEATFLGVKNWFKDYNNWLESSRLGSQGKNLTNNIGTSYYLQRLTCLRLLNQNTKAKNLINSEIIPLMKSQFNSEGGQILENKRTRSWTYSIANLKYWFNIAKIAEDLGVDLLYSNSPLIMGFNYLNQYSKGDRKWSRSQIVSVDYNSSLNTLVPFFERKIHKKTVNSKLSKVTPDFSLSEIKF